MIKVAIHHRENSFSERWIEYCKISKVKFIIVDCFDSDIIKVLKAEKVTHLMWHFHHSSTYDIQVSSYVFNSAEQLGIRTFPNFATRWHFDDKVAQKYMFESLDIPIANSWVFYSREDAEQFISEINFPIVTKLRRGAGSTNVNLLHDDREVRNTIYLMFEKGVSPSGRIFSNLAQKLRLAKKVKSPFLLLKKLIKNFRRLENEKAIESFEKGYIYFQEFMPRNQFDTRIIVVGNKAFGIRRFNRPGDFRASGSGQIDYDIKSIDVNFVKTAFIAAKRIKAQCLAFDFVYDIEKNPKIIEVCYAFSMVAYDRCEGYWDDELNFHKGLFNPQFFMIDDLLKV